MDRIDAIADVIVESALVEAMRFLVGPRSVLEALTKAREVFERIVSEQADGRLGVERMNELRGWLGMVPAPTANATVRSACDG